MKRATLMLLIPAILASPLAAQAADKKPPELGEGKGQVILSWEEFVKITNFDPGKKPDGPEPLKIPWAEVEKLLDIKIEKVGPAATVDLPWQEFKALLEWSVKRAVPKPEVAPPTDFLCSSCQVSGSLGEAGAELTTADLGLDIDSQFPDRRRTWTAGDTHGFTDGAN